MAGHPNKIKVVIVGGGCAGLATAWQLTKLNRELETNPNLPPNRRVAYDITVYEESWRLGGKGASGRDEHGRILEHGLHVWLGFYENAFRMMRECYEQVEVNKWGPHRDNDDDRLAHRTFDDAFIPEPHVGVAVERKNGEMQVWSGYFPPMPGRPGDTLDIDTNPFTLRGYLARSLGLARALLQSIIAPAAGVATPGDPRPDGRSTFDEAAELDFDFDPLQSPGVLVERMTQLLRFGALTTAAGLLQAVTILEKWIQQTSPGIVRDLGVMKFVEAVVAQSRKQLRDIAEVDEEYRRKTEIIDLLMTITAGLYRDRVLFNEEGLDAINKIDYREWLLHHGATKTAANSAFVTGIYDLVFAYENGDRTRRALAAGQALRGALRMFFTYRGAMFWRLGSGMGDAVFAPLYRVLKQRGVQFRFAHELTGVQFEQTEGQRRVSSLVFKRHRTAHSNPLDHLGCWRSTKGDSFDDNPDNLPTKTLTQARSTPAEDDSFDVVVFATGIDRFRDLCGDTLCKELPKWSAMARHVKTVGTVSAQVWLDKDLEELGWRRDSVLVSAFDGRFNTWADMSRTLASERLHKDKADPKKPSGKARSVAYFCGVTPDKSPKGKRHTEARLDLKALLREGLAPVWPNAYAESMSRTPLDLLVAADGHGVGKRHFKDQHVVVNDKGSDRYTLSLPDTLQYRISPLDTSVANMTIAGDWTECGFNAGCVEAAVMSGMLAAHAISGQPDLDAIVGYNHP